MPPRLLIFLALVIVPNTIGGLCLEYAVEFWGTYIKGAPVDIPYLAAALAAIPLSAVALPAAAATFLISFFI